MHSFARRLRPLRAALILALLAPAAAQLLWHDQSSADRDIVALPSFGDGDKQVTVLYRLGDGESAETDAPTFSSSNLYTVGTPIFSRAADGFTNYTYSLTLSGAVGAAPYSISAGGDSLSGTFIAAGLVIKDNGKIVSGDDGDGVTVGQDGTTEYAVEAVGTDGQSVDASGTIITARQASGDVYMEEVDEEITGFSATTFTLRISKLRVGTGAFVVSFEVPAIELNGEVFETVLHVTQTTTPTPPCVVEGGELVSNSGTVEAPMFNLLTPPRASPVSAIVLTVGGTSYSFDSGASSLTLPTSSVVFSGVVGSGSAQITCDGEVATVLEDGQVVSGGLTITSNGQVSEPLAKDTLVQDLPDGGDSPVLTSIVTVVDGNLDTFTKSEGEVILNQYCKTIEAPPAECVIYGLTAGSVIMDLGGKVQGFDKSRDALELAFKTCKFQNETKYACDKLKLGDVQEVNANAATASAGVAGLSTWSIVLISCIGAFALIAVVVLTMWAVHRRSSVLSESSYSSSGPLGVPDPSDLLYEQSIVRDIYGRGEDGGPTHEAAEHSERLAAMREELPRPPSSASGLSRSRAASLDASSTYSV